MKIAVVGGGTRCCNLLDLIEEHSFGEIFPQVVAVADKKDNAPGLVRARENGLFVTKDYNDFFDRDDIDLIMELTGNQDIYNDIVHKKKKRFGPWITGLRRFYVRFLSFTTTRS